MRRGSQLYLDRDGEELPTVASAVDRARRDARELVHQDMLDGPIVDYAIEVADGEGSLVEVVAFSEGDFTSA